MRLLAHLGLIIICMLLSSCQQGGARAPKETVIETPTVKVRHDGGAEKPPVVTDNTNTEKTVIPPKAKITVTETKGMATVMGPGKKAVEVPVDLKTTVIELPADQGATITSTRNDIKITGSAGHAPPPPPTPYETSLSYWTYIGIGVFALGIFFCTPWGGSNFRVGGLIALGGVTMGVLGYLLSTLAEMGLPKWFPAVGFAGVVAAIVLYWGYRLRQKQHADETKQTP